MRKIVLTSPEQKLKPLLLAHRTHNELSLNRSSTFRKANANGRPVRKPAPQWDQLGARLLYAGESARKGSVTGKWEAEATVGGLRRVLTPLLGSFSSLQTDSFPGPV
jgi:hypothetical protein